MIVYVVIGGNDYEGWDEPLSVWHNEAKAHKERDRMAEMHNGSVYPLYDYVEVIKMEVST